MPIAAEVEAALRNAALRLKDAGWQVEEQEQIPSLTEAASIQEQLWLGDGFEQLFSSVERDGDAGAQAVVRGIRPAVAGLPSDVVARALVRRLTEARKWQTFFVDYAVLLVPVSGELPFPDDLDRHGPEGFRRVWDAQLPMRAFPAVGLPGVVVTTGAVGTTPVGVQLVAARFREDLCLEAASDIEARSEPVTVVDPC
jgi:amidase